MADQFPNYVFIILNPNIVDGEHYQIIVDHWANFQEASVSFPAGRSKRERDTILLIDIHQSARRTMERFLAEGDRYIIITHGGGEVNRGHDKEIIETLAADLGWELDSTIVVDCDSSDDPSKANDLPFWLYFTDIDN